MSGPHQPYGRRPPTGLQPIQTFDELNIELLRAVPEFRERYNNHIALTREPLMTVLYGELYGLVQSTVNSSSVEYGRDFLRRVFDYVERAATSSDESINTRIVTGFLNEIRPDDPLLPQFAEYMLPRTRAEWEAYQGAKLPNNQGRRQA